MKFSSMIRIAACLAGAVLLGTYAVAQSGFTIEHNTDRMYGDYRDFDLPSADPSLCQSACAADGKCQAFTYVRPGVQGAAARCWLKDQVPQPRASDCCTTGVRSGGGGGGGAIQIMAATYGGNCGAAYNNAAGHVVSTCNGRGQCDYSVRRDTLGDPAPNCRKDFSTTWHCGDPNHTQTITANAEAGFGRVVRLSCS